MSNFFTQYLAHRIFLKPQTIYSTFNIFFNCFTEDQRRKGLGQAPRAVTLKTKSPRRQAPGKTESGANPDPGLKTKDLRDHPRNDQRKNQALRILQVIQINCW